MKFSVTKNGIECHIVWKNNPIPDEVFMKIYRWVKKSTDYSPLNQRKLMKMRAFVNELNNTYACDVTLDSAISIRNIVLKDKIIKGYSRMNGKIAEIAAKYASGVGILALSKEYDFPPLNLLRGIFLQMGMSASEMYAVFANKENPKSALSGHDLAQFKLALANDAESIINIQKIAKIGADNEDTVVKFFQSLGIGLKTQEELTREQIEKHGRAVITPDILFTTPVYINGTEVKWIDYKDYVGTTIHFLYSSNSDQAKRYHNKWGPGALCYHHGFVSGMTINSTLMLDARALPINLLASDNKQK